MSLKSKPTAAPGLGNCSGCTKLLPKKEILRCSTCKAAFDLECASVDTKRFYSFYAAGTERLWICPECTSRKPKKDNTNTPVHHLVPPGLKSNRISPNGDNVNLTHRNKSKSSVVPMDKEELSDDEVEDSGNNFKILLNEMRAVRQDISTMRETLANLHASIMEQNTRIVSLEARVNTMETEMNAIKSSDVKLLQETIIQLKFDIQDRDQQMLMNDVEISNFPENVNENPTHAFLAVAKKLGLNLEERDIVNVERAGPVRGAVGGGSPPKPRPLVARLARRSTRDALLQAARVRRRVSTEGMGMHGAASPFYINERLTKVNRQLFQRTREAAKRHNWKYTWTRDGKIFSRRGQGETVFRLRMDVDIARVFGADTVGPTVVGTK